MICKVAVGGCARQLQREIRTGFQPNQRPFQIRGKTQKLSRSGQPWHRVERLDNILNWFDKYLQGNPMPQYDVPSEQSTTTAKQQKQ